MTREVGQVWRFVNNSSGKQRICIIVDDAPGPYWLTYQLINDISDKHGVIEDRMLTDGVGTWERLL